VIDWHFRSLRSNAPDKFWFGCIWLPKSRCIAPASVIDWHPRSLRSNAPDRFWVRWLYNYLWLRLTDARNIFIMILPDNQLCGVLSSGIQNLARLDWLITACQGKVNIQLKRFLLQFKIATESLNSLLVIMKWVTVNGLGIRTWNPESSRFCISVILLCPGKYAETPGANISRPGIRCYLQSKENLTEDKAFPER